MPTRSTTHAFIRRSNRRQRLRMLEDNRVRSGLVVWIRRVRIDPHDLPLWSCKAAAMGRRRAVEGTYNFPSCPTLSARLRRPDASVRSSSTALSRNTPSRYESREGDSPVTRCVHGVSAYRDALGEVRSRATERSPPALP